MIHGGLCSITFRDLSPRQIVEAAREAGLAGIEWGGDVHCPHGDVAIAREVGAMTRDAGLAVSSYGSYYRAGPAVGGKDSPEFGAVMESVMALEAPLIRIWAGSCGSDAAEADEAYWAAVAEDTKRIAEIGEAAGVRIAFEYHAGSLTDTLVSTLRLLALVDCDNVSSYWQPPFGSKRQPNLTAVEALGEKLSNLHVFHWLRTAADKIDHRPLAEGEEDWLNYLAEADAVPGDRWALLEFVANGALDAFVTDAATLKAWLGRSREGR